MKPIVDSEIVRGVTSNFGGCARGNGVFREVGDASDRAPGRPNHAEISAQKAAGEHQMIGIIRFAQTADGYAVGCGRMDEGIVRDDDPDV